MATAPDAPGSFQSPALINSRMIAAMRLILVLIGLFSISVDPSQPDHHAPVTYVVLSAYAVYSAVLYMIALRSAAAAQPVQKWAHWVDGGWFILLIAFSHGTSSIFYYFVFFSILVASFCWGFSSGFRLTIAATILFSTAGLAAAPEGADFELNRFLVRVTCLLVLGYMISTWGGNDLLLRRRLALLKEAGTLSNPRFGVDRTIATIMERVREFFDADACLLVLQDRETGAHELRRSQRHYRLDGAEPEPIPATLVQMLLSLPRDHAVTFCASACRTPLAVFERYQAYDVRTKEPGPITRDAVVALAARLDAPSFVTVPVYSRGVAVGRVYVTARRHAFFSAPFARSEPDFLLQLIDHVLPVIDNIRLVDRLASAAAEEERRRIARDLHDSIIQPYIGLQLGLAAVRHRLATAGQVTGDVDRLIDLANGEVADLRRYVGGLKGGGDPERSLLSAVRRFAMKFRSATGLMVAVEADEDVRIGDRLAAEAFQMVVEGLSNVRRHTQANGATVRLGCANGDLVLQIENDGVGDAAPARFTPRSITARAAALGGRASVESPDDGRTVVDIRIPL